MTCRCGDVVACDALILAPAVKAFIALLHGVVRADSNLGPLASIMKLILYQQCVLVSCSNALATWTSVAGVWSYAGTVLVGVVADSVTS